MQPKTIYHLNFDILFYYEMAQKTRVLDFSNRKSKRIVRSIMAAEVNAFMDAFYEVTALTTDFSVLLSRPISIHMFTDSKQLFDALTRGKRTTDKRLIIYIKSSLKYITVLKFKLSVPFVEIKPSRWHEK